MDKQTLSNYGWVIITVLVLAVMIALATPFGSYIKEATQSTLSGLNDTDNKAMDTALHSLGIYKAKDLSGGLFVGDTDVYAKININGKQEIATWENLIKGDYVRVSEDGTLMNGANISQLSGKLVIGGEISNILSESWDSENSFLSGSNISKVVMMDGITKIGACAFNKAQSLETIVIPKTVKEIGGFFAGKAEKVSEIIVAEDNPYFSSENGVLYSKDKTTLVRYPVGIKNETFVIPDTVKTIGYTAFRHMRNLKTVYCNDGLENVSQMAFEGARSITDIYINDKVDISNWAIFRDCRNVNFHLNETNERYLLIDNVIYTKDMKTLIVNGYQADGILEIPDGVTYFSNIICGTFDTLILPTSITKIRDDSIPYYMKTIKYRGTEEQFYQITFPKETNDSYKYIVSATKIFNYNP